MTLYATLDDAKNAQKATTTVDDDILLRNLRTVSRRIDRLMESQRPYFAPTIETRQFVITRGRVRSADNTFLFDDPLLALTSVTVGSDALIIGTNVELWPTLTSPATRLRLVNNWDSWYTYCATSGAPLVATLMGTWGWHRQWGSAWLDVTTLGAAIVSTTATTLTVTDIDGTDAYGRSPWMSAGALLKIGTEYLEVTATNTTTNVATVRRGVNGSTAATHLNGATVSVYQVEEDIRDVVARQAAFKYSRRGAFESATITDLATVQFPSDLLGELRGVLTGYAYE